MKTDKKCIANMASRVDAARKVYPLTLNRENFIQPFMDGQAKQASTEESDGVDSGSDRVVCQDATARIAKNLCMW
jgi:hypothetical protein